MATEPLAKSGDGGDHREMDMRLTRIEEDMREVKTDLRAVRSDITGIRTDVAELKGRMTGIEGRLAQLPTAWQMFSFMLALMGSLFAIVRFGIPH